MNEEELAKTVSIYNEYLDRMCNAAQHLNEDLVDNSTQEVHMVLPVFVEGLEWLNEAIINFVQLGMIEPKKYEQFQQLMQNLLEALENKDYILLQDLCEFEMMPLLQELKIKADKLNS